MSLIADKPRAIVASVERAEIDRNVLIWLNTCPLVPVETDAVKTESQLSVNQPGMAVSAITSAYVNRYYITGGYQAEYDFTLIYRIKPGNSMDKSLQANEALNHIGDWTRENKPYLGDRINVTNVTPTSGAITYALYEDGDEDHHIEIKIVYEVN